MLKKVICHFYKVAYGHIYFMKNQHICIFSNIFSKIKNIIIAIFKGFSITWFQKCWETIEISKGEQPPQVNVRNIQIARAHLFARPVYLAFFLGNELSHVASEGPSRRKVFLWLIVKGQIRRAGHLTRHVLHAADSMTRPAKTCYTWWWDAPSPAKSGTHSYYPIDRTTSCTCSWPT